MHKSIISGEPIPTPLTIIQTVKNNLIGDQTDTPNNSIDIDTGATDRRGSTDTQGARIQTERAWDEDVTPSTLITDEYAPFAIAGIQ